MRKPIHLRLDEGLLKLTDERAVSEDRTRTSIVEAALRQHLGVPALEAKSTPAAEVRPSEAAVEADARGARRGGAGSREASPDAGPVSVPPLASPRAPEPVKTHQGYAWERQQKINESIARARRSR